MFKLFLSSCCKTRIIACISNTYISGQLACMIGHPVCIDSLFTLLHEIEAGTTCNHIILNFKCDDGSSSQIVMQTEVLDCVSLY